MLRVSQYQLHEFDEATRNQQRCTIINEFAAGLESDDPVAAQKLRSYAGQEDHWFFERVLSLTDVYLYQQALLLIHLDTGIDFFSRAEFCYLMDHPLLTGNSKARHLVLSAAAIIEEGE